MKQKKNLRKILLTLFAFLFVSCAKVPIKNAEVCGDMGTFGASCFNTLNDQSRDLSQEEWDKERFGMLCTKSDNFTHWQASIMKLCRSARGRCTYDIKKKIVKFYENVDSHNQRIYEINLNYPEIILKDGNPLYSNE